MLFEKRVDEEHRPHTPHGNVERTVPEAGPHDPEEVPFLAEALTMRRHSPPYVRGTPNRGIEQDRNSKVTSASHPTPSHPVGLVGPSALF